MLEDLPNDQILNALENAKPAVMAEAQLQQLEAQAIRFAVRRKLQFNRSTIIGIAAGLLLLITANAILIQYRMKKTTPSMSAQSVQEYNLIPVKSIYYE